SSLSSKEDLGEILLVRIIKEQYLLFPTDTWFCSYITVTCPKGEHYRFPLYKWIEGFVWMFPRGRVRTVRSNLFHNDRAPRCINTDSPTDLPHSEQFSLLKDSSFSFTLWKEDKFFGYQYLNGINPVMIKKCLRIPDNFPVDDVTVISLLYLSSLCQQNGNIFLADCKILEGIPTNVINEEPQYLVAPLCLLWKSPQNKVVPIAIQLNQTPGEENPIFMPTDPEWDWILAKIWVRNSDCQVHQLVTHFLHTHLFAEVFNIATNRQLPMGHPIYKLLIPHLRFTLDINTLARKQPRRQL
uniref:Lipoxygenase domain-containing protein n=1 Tax=Xenopus tropicalis TaxID=8364 RepID=A0A6I8S9S2_XENTR